MAPAPPVHRKEPCRNKSCGRRIQTSIMYVLFLYRS